MKISKIAEIINILLKALIVSGVISLFFVDNFVNTVMLVNQSFYTVFFIILDLCCIYIIFEITNIFKSVVLENPFIKENEVSLKKIAVTCEGIAILFFLKLILDYTIFNHISMISNKFDVFNISTLVFMILFFVAGLCAYVLSQLFKLSVFLKEENDMTI